MAPGTHVFVVWGGQWQAATGFVGRLCLWSASVRSRSGDASAVIVLRRSGLSESMMPMVLHV